MTVCPAGFGYGGFCIGCAFVHAVASGLWRFGGECMLK